MSQEDELTTTQAAERAGVTINAIQQAIRRGKLKARKRGRDLFIKVSDFEIWLTEQRHTPGRPKTAS